MFIGFIECSLDFFNINFMFSSGLRLIKGVDCSLEKIN